MIKELTDLYKFFSDIDRHLMTIVDKWPKKVGISEDINNEVKEMKRKLKGI